MASTIFLERLSAAIADGDPDGFAELLADDARWGGLEDGGKGVCRSRQEILAWYRRGVAEGADGRLIELVAHGDHVLVGLIVQRRPDDEETTRFQVLTVASDRIAEIRAYETRHEALDFLADR